MEFHLLFTISVSHNYYRENCPDFSFIIPRDSQKRLKNGRLIAKVRGGRLAVFYEADDSGGSVVPLEGQTLRWGLKLLNPYFSNFTNLSFAPLTPIYGNQTNPQTLDTAEPMTLVGDIFGHELRENNRPLIVRLKNHQDQPLEEQTITSLHNRSTVSYDVTNLPPGVYGIEESNVGGTQTQTTLYYCDGELVREKVFGVIEIQIDSSFYSTPPTFTIPFEAKEQTLQYYVIAKNYSDTDLSQLSIVDNDADRNPQITFNKIPSSNAPFSEDGTIAATLLAQIEEDEEILLFQSNNPLRRQEEAPKNLQLQKQQNGTPEQLIKHLPQPGADKANATVIVKLIRVPITS